jgi:mannan endo-1,4-beta-mannosidase
MIYEYPAIIISNDCSKEKTMKDKTLYQLASLVMALVMILGNTIYTQAAPVAQTTGPSIYWGAMVDGKVPSSTNLQGVFAAFETRSKKKMSIIHWGQPWMMQDGSWGEFQTSYFQNVRNHGSIPMINWASWRLGSGVNQPNFQLRDIYGGTYDTYIRRWATAAKNWGHPFFLRFNHEMNGWWYPWGEGKLSNGTIVNGNSPGDFVKAWRHVHGIFQSVGATNVTWVWAPNHMSTSSQYPALSTLYAGDAYVGWTGLSAYNKYNTWAGLNPLLTGSSSMTWFKNSYNAVLTVAPTKPMMLAETASVEAGDGGTKKAAWIKDALTTQIPINFPKIKAIVWMNWAVNGKTYPIQSSLAATNAWAAAIGSTKYAANLYARLSTSPIPVPAAALTGASEIPEASPTEAQATLGTSPTAVPATLAASPAPVPATLEASPTAAPATLEASPTATPATLTAIADTYIDSANPNLTAGGTNTTLYVGASPVRTTFLKFDLTPLAGKTISTVTLKFKTTSDPNAGSVDSLTLKLVSDVLWKERYMSYNNTVAVSPTVLGIVPANSAPNTWYEITLAAAPLQQNFGGLLSVAIEATGSDDLLLYSREAADQPQLVITYN